MKSFFSSLAGIGLSILIIIAFGLLIAGGAHLFEIIYPFLERVNYIVWGIVWILIILSIAPKLRRFTGSGIVALTYVGGAIFWLLSFYTTYSLWGLLGIIIGVLFLGFGVFFTAILALLFDGQFLGAFYFALSLFFIYLFRWIGYKINSKYHSSKLSAVDELAKLGSK